MPGGLSGRVFGLAMAAWFSVATLSRAFAHECASDSHASSVAVAAGSETAEHQEHVSHGAPTDLGDSGKSAHECDCLGQCCPSTVPTLVAENSVASTVVLVVELPTAGATEFRPLAVEHVLPFVIGPPQHQIA